jgi:hypothetical protein
VRANLSAQDFAWGVCGARPFHNSASRGTAPAIAVGAVAVQRFEPRPLNQSGFRGSCRAISPMTEEMA